MPKHIAVAQFCFPALVAVAFLAVATTPAGAQTPCNTGVCVLTWQDDTYRTGNNLNESIITYNTITTDNFGRLCTASLDGQVYAQPLVVTNVKIGSTTWPNVVYVVTENDTLYAIDGNPQDGNAPCSILNGSGSGTSLLNFLPPGQFAVPCQDISHCETIDPKIGILGTPVVNVSGSTGTMYLVTETEDPNGNFYHYLHVIDIGSFTEPSGSPIRVAPPGSTSAQASAFSEIHIQRPGLLFANCGAGCNTNYIYIAFSMMDGTGYPYPNGAIFGYNASNLGGSFFYLPTSVGRIDSSNGAGIWMGAAAPAYGTDSSGDNWIYLTTANGTFDLSNQQPPNTDAGDSLLKLNPNGLALPATNGYFTPADQYYRSAYNVQNCEGDEDFGSGAPMLIPDNQLTNWPYLAVSGDKEGGLWFMNRTTPGGYSMVCGNNCPCQQPSSNVQTYWTGTPYAGHTIHGGMAFWEYDLVTPFLDYMFAAAGGGQLTRYSLCASPRATSPIDPNICGAPIGSVSPLGQAIRFPYGTTPSVTANGDQATDAVVWAIAKPDSNAPEGTTPGILYAFDASTM